MVVYFGEHVPGEGHAFAELRGVLHPELKEEYGNRNGATSSSDSEPVCSKIMLQFFSSWQNSLTRTF